MGEHQMLSSYGFARSGRGAHLSLRVLDCEALDRSIVWITKKLDGGEITYDELVCEVLVFVPPSELKRLRRHCLLRQAYGAFLHALSGVMVEFRRGCVPG